MIYQHIYHIASSLLLDPKRLIFISIKNKENPIPRGMNGGICLLWVKERTNETYAWDILVSDKDLK
jgi:hypothetical protein